MKILKFALFFLLILTIALPVFAYENINPIDVKQKLDADDDVFILDVRQPEEYAQGYVPGAYLISLGDLGKRMNEVPKDRYLIVVCQAGGRSAKASQQLEDSGYKNIHNMLGGTPAFKALPAYLCIKAQDLKAQLPNANFFILDVRTTKEYDKDHIQDAISIPIDQLSDRKDLITQNKTVIVIGADDDQSSQASKKLIDLGFKDVKSLEDGMLSWAIVTGVSRERKLVTTFGAIKSRM